MKYRRGRVHQGRVSPPWPTVKEWEMKGVIRPLGTRSWRWVAAGSGEPLKSLLQAGLQNEGSAMTREAAMSREFVL